MRNEGLEEENLEIEVNNKINSMEELDNNLNDKYIMEIDILLDKMKNYNLKSTSYRIFTYFKKNNYNGIPIDKIFDILSNEYDSNPEIFFNSLNEPINSKKKLIGSYNLTMRSSSFIILNIDNIKYVKLNPKKALEYLTNIYQKSLKSESNKSTRKKKKSRKKDMSGTSTHHKRNMKSSPDNYIGKKRNKSKKIIEKEIDAIDIDVDINEKNEDKNKNNIIMKNINIQTSNDYNESFSTEKINSNNLIFFQGLPLKKTLTNFTFNDAASCNNNETFNSNNNIDIIKLQNESKSEILFQSKKEEKIYDLLKKEIKPISTRIIEINNMLNYKQKKLSSIATLLQVMDANLNEYRNIKGKLIKDSHSLKTCYKGMEGQIKFFKLFHNLEFTSNKNEIFSMHLLFIKKYLKISKNIVDKNEKRILKLNDYGIKFGFCKLSIENEVKEIIGNNYDFIFVDSLKSFIKPELIKYFHKLSTDNNNNDDNNDFKYIYDDNTQLRKIYENYVEKVELLEKNLIS